MVANLRKDGFHPGAGARIAAAIAGLMLPGAAVAQDAAAAEDEQVLLDTITVEGQSGRGLAAGRTEGTGTFTPPATNTATKFVLTPRETPQTVAVVTNQVIEDFNLTNVRQVLETAPFINVYTERSPGVFVVNTRGTEEMDIQFDGIPGPASVGSRGALPFDTAFIDRTEIVYGAQGLLGGLGGAGGVINIVRKMPTPTFQATLETGVDSEGSGRLVGDISGPLNQSGALRGRVIGVLYDQDSFVEDAWVDTKSVYGVLEADVREGTTLALGGMYVDYEAATAAGYGLPTMVDGSFVDLPRDVNLGADWGRDKREGEYVFLKFDQDLPADWELRGALNYTHSQSRLREAIPQGPFFPGEDYLYVVQAQKEGWENTTWSLDSYAAGTVNLFGRTHELMLGVNWLKNQEHTIGGYWVDGIANPRDEWSVLQVSYAFRHRPGSVPRPRGSDWWQAWGPWDSETRQLGAYAGGRFSVAEGTHLILGGRGTWWEYEDGGLDTIDETAFTPYAAITWDFNEWGTAYASYSRIYEPSTLFDASGGVLPPVEGHNYEAGVKGSFFGGRLDASLAVYRLVQENLPEDDYASGMVCNGWYCAMPAGEVVTKGVDIGLSGAITPDWNVLAGYSYVSSDHNDTGEPFSTYYPENTFKLSTTYDLMGDRLTVGGQIRWQSKVYDEGVYGWSEGGVDYEEDYRVEQKPYTVVDLMARYRLTEQASILLNVDNIFDEEYYEGISWPRHGNNYGAPRTATVTLTTTF
ncbi:TonB-dependent siderophore receptor [Amaricoccus sp.]|uniref:TonB-dependent siderophore receptor n=1 Tax=Amaricoccus sp. TaxID=1872485 RepID=UPI001B42D97B|nr:TonB-dependent siderophore receptor [Amaricoccus sp.]MBP7000680.1 TonB-dependent siderophore receptor [Amaricoccus sp.]